MYLGLQSSSQSGPGVVDYNKHVSLHSYAQRDDCFAILNFEIPEKRKNEERFT